MFIPHLHYRGNCNEAITLYEKAFTVKADSIIRNDDGSVMHAEMHIHGQRVMMNDRFGNNSGANNCAIAAVITFSSAEGLLACYEIMKQDSVMIDLLQKASYTELGVQFLDKFGVQWAFMVEDNMRLHGACIQTHNIEDMLIFYKKIFGYNPIIDGGVDFRFLDNQLVIFKLTDTTMPATKSAALIYTVDDVDQKYKQLSDLGIVNDPPTDKPWGVRSFIIHDPDGNTVSFMKNLEKVTK